MLQERVAWKENIMWLKEKLDFFLNKENLKKRYGKFSEEHRSKKLKIVNPEYGELEDKLFEWICVIRKAKLTLSPSLVLSKASEIAPELQIDKEKFKASWRWLSSFRQRRGLKGMTLYGEESKFNKDGLELLSKLEELYNFTW